MTRILKKHEDPEQMLLEDLVAAGISAEDLLLLPEKTTVGIPIRVRAFNVFRDLKKGFRKIKNATQKT